MKRFDWGSCLWLKGAVIAEQNRMSVSESWSKHWLVQAYYFILTMNKTKVAQHTITKWRRSIIKSGAKKLQIGAELQSNAHYDVSTQNCTSKCQVFTLYSYYYCRGPTLIILHYVFRLRLRQWHGHSISMTSCIAVLIVSQSSCNKLVFLCQYWNHTHLIRFV